MPGDRVGIVSPNGGDARCHDGAMFEADAAILNVRLPLLSEIALPSAVRKQVVGTADIGFGNVAKIQRPSRGSIGCLPSGWGSNLIHTPLEDARAKDRALEVLAVGGPRFP
jgi:hypothetical protein